MGALVASSLVTQSLISVLVLMAVKFACFLYIYRVSHSTFYAAVVPIGTPLAMNSWVQIGAYLMTSYLPVIQFRDPSVMGSRWWSSWQTYKILTNITVYIIVSKIVKAEIT